MSDRECVDECPTCGTIAAGGWVLGHYYCVYCNHTFDGSGDVLSDGRYIDNGSENNDR